MLLSRGSIPGTSQWVAEWAHQPPHTLLLCRRRSQRLGETMPFPCLNLSTCALAVGFQFWVSLDICPCIVFGTYATDCQTCFRRFCLGSGWERIFWEIPGIPTRSSVLHNYSHVQCLVRRCGNICWLGEDERMHFYFFHLFSPEQKEDFCGKVEFCADVVEFCIGFHKCAWTARHQPLKCTSEEWN